MAFKEYISPEIRLPINGKVYVIKDPPYQAGLQAQQLMGVGAMVAFGGDDASEDQQSAVLSDEDERRLYPSLIGATWDEMLADGVGTNTLQLVGATVLIWVTYDLATAERYWHDEGQAPKEPRAPQDHLAKSGRQGSTGSRTTQKRQPRKATAGPTSSTTGTS